MASSKPRPATAAPAASSDQSTTGDGAPNRPVHSIRIKNIRGAIWGHDSGNGPWYNATFSRSYKDDTDGQWKSSDSFSRDDLLTLAKVADLCHTWITDTLQVKDGQF